MTKPVVYVGIDVACEKLDVCFIDGDGAQLRDAAIYDNDPPGWKALRADIVALVRARGHQSRCVCGMESTGDFHKRLEQALRKEQRRKLEVHVLNPMAVKHFRTAMLVSAKTDKVDARCIALFLARMQPPPGAPIPDAFETLKTTTRSRRCLIETRTSFKNRLHKLLRFNFPGYRKFVGRTLSMGLLHVLTRYPSPDLLLAQSVEAIAAIASGPRSTVGTKLATKLHELARLAPDSALPKVTQITLRTNARQILDLSAHIAELDAAIEELCDELFPDQQLTSIPGIGKVSAAAILAEVGDVARFPDKVKFVGYCGLYPMVWESGQCKRRFRMTRKGNRMLKMTLLVASGAARLYNPAIRDFYHRLRQRGKSTKAAGGALARKLAHFVYVVLATGQPWSEEIAMRGLAKAEAMTTRRAA